VKPKHPLQGFILPAGAAIISAAILMGAATLRSQQNTTASTHLEVSATAAASVQPSPPAPQPKVEAKKSNLDKTKDDAAELSALADKLKDELDKLNANVFSLDVIQKTEQLEKLARKIKGEANQQ
jgi:uncharacterized protein YggE